MAIRAPNGRKMKDIRIGGHDIQEIWVLDTSLDTPRHLNRIYRKKNEQPQPVWILSYRQNGYVNLIPDLYPRIMNLDSDNPPMYPVGEILNMYLGTGGMDMYAPMFIISEIKDANPNTGRSETVALKLEYPQSWPFPVDKNTYFGMSNTFQGEYRKVDDSYDEQMGIYLRFQRDEFASIVYQHLENN